MANNGTISLANYMFDVNSTILKDIDPNEKSILWIDSVDVTEIYNRICLKNNVQPCIINERLLSDIIYEPIKDMCNYNANKGIFTTICHFTYLIGHAVGQCSIQLMLVMFLTLCSMNHIVVYRKISEKLIELFTMAYNREIHFSSFEHSLTNFLIECNTYFDDNNNEDDTEYVDDDSLSFVSQIDGGLPYSAFDD